MRRKHNKRRNNKLHKFLVIGIFALLFVMASGYAILTQDLFVKGNASIVPMGSEYILSIQENNMNQYGLYYDSDSLEHYYAGKNNIQNYITFADKNWRIISFSDEGIKIMLEYSLSTNNNWHSSRLLATTWPKSTALTTLSTWYTNNLNNYSKYIVQNPSWEAGTVSSNKLNIVSTSSKYSSSPIGLISSPEFNRSISGSSWVTGSSNQWTMNKVYLSAKAVYINASGKLSSASLTTKYCARPVVVLKNDIHILGNGSQTDPFRIVG